MRWYRWTRSKGSSPFGGEPIVAVDVLGRLHFDYASHAFLPQSCAAPVRTFCRTLCPGNDDSHPVSATTMSQNWRQVIEEGGLCKVIGQRPPSARRGPNVPRADVL